MAGTEVGTRTRAIAGTRTSYMVNVKAMAKAGVRTGDMANVGLQDKTMARSRSGVGEGHRNTRK